jgi:hypothetical protein
MNTSMITALMRKDFHFFHRIAVGYLVFGLLAIALASVPGTPFFMAGGILLVTTLSTLGMHLPVVTVLGERRNQTLAFLMSLPITPAEYTWSKLAFNLLSYFGVWSLLLFACIGAIRLQDHLPYGLIPFLFIVFGGCAAYAVLVLAAALVRDSLDKTIRAVVFWNVVLQGTVYSAATNRAIHVSMQGDTVLWSADAFGFLLAELVLIIAGLGATLRLQSRKTQFI